jgi:M6 family metalloprotease-like protein
LIKEGYETIYQHRRKLDIHYNYTTRWLSPELCRSLNEVECQTWDEAYGKAVEKNKKFLTAERRRELQGPQTKELRILVMLLWWPNHADRELIPLEDIEQLFNSDGIDEVLFPTGSIARYFDVSSYGQFSITADVIPWAMTDESESFYAAFGSSGRDPGLQSAFIPLLDMLDGGGFDFSLYDADDDGEIDLTVFLHSGFTAEIGGTDCYTGAGSSERIGSHATTAAEGLWTSRFGYNLGPYTVAAAQRGVCNSNIARIGVIAHEITHNLGLPDLYDIEGALNPTGSIGGLGKYDIMVRHLLTAVQRIG